ncbi:hypothetical protein [Nocardia sp. NPDC024068]|uniref:nuclear transport factor 2 family protein n=1 Tax=Nocardia sp. NPDC024068 TaxID=3157197 RepID=UPI0033E2028C
MKANPAATSMVAATTATDVLLTKVTSTRRIEPTDLTAAHRELMRDDPTDSDYAGRFLAMSATWDRFEIVEQTILSDTDPLVALNHIHARSRATGRELEFPILQTITVIDGRITAVRPFYWDTAAITAACAPPPGLPDEEHRG